ncbi:hypothetical protein OIE66_15690 [Nonomuraea sp. NBC_01738]|uniref:hypothetical protein n=1 Tax=Nonomuraea sp. NBC_01738 TaxID=2976003 RepID=UPI002E0F4418|nr:hypothetical protein OIE66_15690 [Nonomuraea sp. NBC_01738]
MALALAALSMSAPASGAIARAADEPICDGVTGDPHKNLATGEIEATLTVKCTQVTRQIEVYLFLDRDGTIAAKHAARNFDNKEGPPLTVATPCRTGNWRAIGYYRVTFTSGQQEYKRADSPAQGLPALKITC